MQTRRNEASRSIGQIKKEGGDASGAQQVVLSALEHHPDEPQLGDLRIELSRHSSL